MSRISNKVTFSFALIALVLFSSSIIATSQAADYAKIGVRVGDRADYSIANPNHDRLRLEVTEVTGVFVNITITDYWSNGTVVDFTTARGNVSNGGLAEVLLCGGLQAGDLLYPGAGMYFNYTVSMEIAGAMRTVNEIIISGDQHVYYDQETGIFAKMAHPGHSNVTMISTNMWRPVDPVVLILIGGGGAAVAAIVVAAIILQRRRK
ncbi:MAG: hypothetical protein WED04_09710 [Promethearchaeati archaeon SRVP18_Atabeyarchaeia-1]